MEKIIIHLPDQPGPVQTSNKNCTLLDLRLFSVEMYVDIQSLSQTLSGTLKNERCKLGEYFNTNSTCIGFITFNNLIRPALVCLGYLYLFPPGHIPNIFFDPIKPILGHFLPSLIRLFLF